MSSSNSGGLKYTQIVVFQGLWPWNEGRLCSQLLGKQRVRFLRPEESVFLLLKTPLTAALSLRQKLSYSAEFLCITLLKLKLTSTLKTQNWNMERWYIEALVFSPQPLLKCLHLKSNLREGIVCCVKILATVWPFPLACLLWKRGISHCFLWMQRLKWQR